jgi:transposase
MDRYIGLDVHATSCTLTVVGPSGRKLSSQVLETNGQLLIEAIRAIAHPRHLCFEEGIQSAWLHELLSPHVDELVVMQSTRSRGPKSDARDALALAQALRLGSIDTIVFKAPKLFTRLRELTKVHSMIVQDATRTQCRIKALFRGRGIATAGKSVYNVAERQVWVSKLPESTQSVAGFLYTQLEANQQLKKEVERNLISELGHYPIGRVLQTCPGLGPIRTARLLSIVMTPHRFRTARQTSAPQLHPQERTDFEDEHPLFHWSRQLFKTLRVSYASSEFQTKPWLQEALIERWFPPLTAEKLTGSESVTSCCTHSDARRETRHCIRNHSPIWDTNAECQNEDVRRTERSILDIPLHRRRNEQGGVGVSWQEALQPS